MVRCDGRCGIETTGVGRPLQGLFEAAGMPIVIPRTRGSTTTSRYGCKRELPQVPASNRTFTEYGSRFRGDDVYA